MIYTLHRGDCLEIMRQMISDGVKVHSVVTDPPYHLTSIVKRFGAENAAPAKSAGTGVFQRSSAGFMGKKWDGGDIAFQPDTWRLAYELLVPGGYLAAFGAAKNAHRMACAIEDAGFEIRDTLMWLYATGFPKSHQVGHHIEKQNDGIDGTQWKGWGTALKPAYEPIILARKPPTGTIAANTLAHGTGGLNIDATRIGERWPSNVLSDGSLPHALQRYFFSAKADADDKIESKHPTVKPVALMRWLVRLITPPGGTVLDPFAGTGTTGVAAIREGMKPILIERETEYQADIERRMRRFTGQDTPLFENMNKD